MKACMGGWCRIRESCPNYNAADRRYPADHRLCIKGRDGVQVLRIPVLIKPREVFTRIVHHLS